MSHSSESRVVVAWWIRSERLLCAARVLASTKAVPILRAPISMGRLVAIAFNPSTPTGPLTLMEKGASGSGMDTDLVGRNEVPSLVGVGKQDVELTTRLQIEQGHIAVLIAANMDFEIFADVVARSLRPHFDPKSPTRRPLGG